MIIRHYFLDNKLLHMLPRIKVSCSVFTSTKLNFPGKFYCSLLITVEQHVKLVSLYIFMLVIYFHTVFRLPLLFGTIFT